MGTLQLSAPTSGPDANNLMLQGVVQVANASQIHTVRTHLWLCLPTQAPSLTCGVSMADFLTEKDVTSLNINVQAGQTIDVRVVISFS